MQTDSAQIDLISELPQSVIEVILTKLPIRDAVRTSILSTKWRYKWASITHIVFDDKSAAQFNDSSASVQVQIVKFITRLLFLHDGPIHKFSLSSSFLENSPDIDQWLLFVSRKDVKELVLELGEGEWFKAPSCIFSCKKLTRLELIRCEFNPLSNFKGFLCLKRLSLQQVMISPEDIESLISSCPLLESLVLSYFDSLELTICAPNLKHLILEGEFKELCLTNTPLLVDLSVALYMNDDMGEHIEQHGIGCYFDQLFGGVPKLERLTGHIYFTKYLSFANDLGRSPITYSNLKSIELYQVGFDDFREVLAMLQLITTSPILEHLQISGSSNAPASFDPSDLDIWECKDWTDFCMLKKLKTVKLTEMSGAPHEMRLIKYLLEKSPALEKMTIKPSMYVAEGKLSILIDLVGFTRASPQASVVFTDDLS